MSGRALLRFGLAVAMPMAPGCSLSSFAADQAGEIAAESVDRMRGFWDHEIAGQGNAAGIMQLEGLYGFSSDDEQLALTLSASYVGYAFGWVEVLAERAEDCLGLVLPEVNVLRAPASSPPASRSRPCRTSCSRSSTRASRRRASS